MCPEAREAVDTTLAGRKRPIGWVQDVAAGKESHAEHSTYIRERMFRGIIFVELAAGPHASREPVAQHAASCPGVRTRLTAPNDRSVARTRVQAAASPRRRSTVSQPRTARRPISSTPPGQSRRPRACSPPGSRPNASAGNSSSPPSTPRSSPAGASARRATRRRRWRHGGQTRRSARGRSTPTSCPSRPHAAPEAQGANRPWLSRARIRPLLPQRAGSATKGVPIGLQNRPETTKAPRWRGLSQTVWITVQSGDGGN